MTNEKRQKLIEAYIREGHTPDEIVGFIDGIDKREELENNKNQKQ